MNKFSEFVKEENTAAKQEKTNIQTDDISELVDKYSTYSQDDLMKEFLSEGKKKKENGEFTEENISKIKRVLSPYLDENQKQKLNDLINMVK